MDTGSIFGIMGAIFFLGALVTSLSNRKKADHVVAVARDAGDKYHEAVGVRKEAYRVLSLVARMDRAHAAGFVSGRDACVAKLKEMSRLYATRPESQSVAGHIDEMSDVLKSLDPSPRA